jgi:SsrA-binding protein
LTIYDICPASFDRARRYARAMAKKGGKRKAAPGDVATNRQASHRFELLDKMECGIVLQGTEVKSLRTGSAQLKDGYAAIRDGELWLHNVHIPPYRPANRDNHDPERPRKLLAHRREIARLVGKTQERGLTLVPTRLYFAGPRAKVEIALARGKDRFDKRESLKAKDQQREIQRALRDAER